MSQTAIWQGLKERQSCGLYLKAGKYLVETDIPEIYENGRDWAALTLEKP